MCIMCVPICLFVHRVPIVLEEVKGEYQIFLELES